MQEFVTRQGEALYIPLGWRHFATPVDASPDTNGDRMDGKSEIAVAPRQSVHVTMGVQLPRWGDLIDGACLFVFLSRVIVARFSSRRLAQCTSVNLVIPLSA